MIKNTQRRDMIKALGATALLACATRSNAQTKPDSTYPTRPIQLIVAFAPGGGTDLIARLLARQLEKQLGGVSVVVQNKPGAGGAIGLNEVAKSAADGYTIGIVNTHPLMSIPIERKSNFTWRSFDLLGNLVDDPCGFAVLNSSPLDLLSALTTYAKAHPGEVTVGTGGTGTDDHLALLMFERATGTKLRHIPYKGASEVRIALAAGQIMVGSINFGEVLQFAKGGTPIKLLGHMGKTRDGLADNIPTFKEQGVDVALSALRGVAAPKGLPEPIRRRLVAVIAAIAADPDFRKQAEAMFAPLRYLGPEQFSAEVQRGDADLRQLWKEIPWSEGS